MRKDGQQASGPEVQFVWESETPGGGTAKPSSGVAGVAGQRRILSRRTLLIGSSALILLAGTAFGATALSTQHHHATAGAAAITLPNTLPPVPTHGAVSALPTSPSPRPSPSVSRSATPDKSPTAAATHSTAAAQNLNPIAATGAGSVAAPVATSAPAAAAPATAKPSAPTPAGDWLLNQTVGNVAVDSTGAHDGTAQDGWWNAGDGCLFNGTNSQIYTNGPVLSTGSGESFTVSAWVDMTALPASGQYDETAVSQDAGEDSGFYLQYTEPADRWAFSRTGTNGQNPTAYRALSASAPSLDTWTHLVGVYDAANDTQYLYVNGVAQGTATDSTPFTSSGDLAIGRAMYNGQETDWLKGAIKKVEVFNAALSAAQVSALS